MNGCAYLGGAPGGSAEGNGYAGSFAGVQILTTVLDEDNALCLVSPQRQERLSLPFAPSPPRHIPRLSLPADR